MKLLTKRVSVPTAILGPTSHCFIAATLKNDDAEDSDEEGEDNEAVARESKALRKEPATKHTNGRQPTGRIVGVIKRNWRA